MEENGTAPATKADIERVLATIRELNAGLEQRIGTDVARLEHRIDSSIETMRDIETSLLTSFHNYARGQQARMHGLERAQTADRDIVLRLQSLEDRLLDLESRFPKRAS
jgi:hypothetical protein